MANFCSDLCSGLAGNCRYCMTTPITRTKVYWSAGILGGIVLFIIILCVSLPSSGSSSPDNNVGLDKGVAQGIFFLKQEDRENIQISKIKDNLDGLRTNNKDLKLQVISAAVPCTAQYHDAVPRTLEQLDILTRLVGFTPPFALVTSFKEAGEKAGLGNIPVLLSVYGGHSIDGRLSVLRTYYRMGVRMLTITADGCSTPWAKSANNGTQTVDDDFLKSVVTEMNRLGMLIDIGALDRATQATIIKLSSAPVVALGVGFSTVNNNSLNLDSDTVDVLKEHNGLLMLSTDCNLIAEDPKNCDGAFTGLLKKAKNRINVGFGGSLNPSATISPELKNLEDYFGKLLKDGTSLPDLRKLAIQNFLDTFQKVEEKAADIKNTTEEFFKWKNLIKNYTECYTNIG